MPFPPRFSPLFVFLLLLLVCCPAAAKTRVACVGDSITFGSKVAERERYCYPAQLQDMLGEGYEVRNFGVSGATLLSQGNKPYVQQEAYKQALAFEPNVVVVMLGTNDTKQVNWQHADQYVADYENLIASFRELPGKPEVIIALPVPAWSSGGDIDGGRVREGVLPRVRQVAHDTGTRMVNLYTPMLKHEGLFPDKVHPNSRGAEQMAKLVYEAVTLKTDAGFDISPELPENAQPFDFHGYDGLGFDFNGVAAKVVKPKVAAEGRPWVWRARFWGHEPQTDLALLERGFHVVYCDVASLFGNPVAVQRWDAFYAAMRQAGLGEDLVLEGMSRGGLIIYNWASKNPEKVRAIYGDAPVCDIRSWPGGKGTGRGAAREWEQCLDAYGLNEETAAAFTGSPIDRLKPLAQARVPLLHVVGDADEIVPPAENSDVLETRYRELGGEIHVIRKPGVGHHPHSLPDPQPIVDFFLAATGRKVNFAAIAKPSAEDRGAQAGWGGGTWWNQHENINQLGKDHPDIDVIFFGDSISQGLTGSEKRLAEPGGGRAFDRYFGDDKAASFGIAGDRTEYLAYRVTHGNFDAIKPRVIVLMIGVNNIRVSGDTGDEIAEGTALVLAALAKHAPQARVLLLGCFPTGPTADHVDRRQVDVLHQRLAVLADGERVVYRDLRPLFLNADGTPNGKMRGDHVHLTPEGNEAWLKAVKPQIDAMLRR